MENTINATIEETIGEPVLDLHLTGKHILNPFYIIHTARVNNKHNVAIYEKKDGISCTIIS